MDMELGIALGWHGLAYEALLDVVRHAEARGIRAAFVDGDVSQIPSRGDGDVLDGWTVATALLAQTERIEIGSIRLVHHWNAAKLAQAVATIERIAPGRHRLLVSVGGQPTDRRFGLAVPPAGERVAWLGETLQVARALWRGEDVHFDGRFVQVDGARVRPVPPVGRPQVTVAARGPKLLGVLATHGDAWDVNLPPIASRVDAAAAHLAIACRRVGRDPDTIPRSMWIFARPHGDPDDPEVHAAYRRFNPWYADVPDDALADVVLCGGPERTRDALARHAARLQLALPVADLSGLGHDAALQAIDALRPPDD